AMRSTPGVSPGVFFAVRRSSEFPSVLLRPVALCQSIFRAMKSRFLTAYLLVACTTLFAAEQPLRIFIRAGKKTHGPAGNGQHDGPTFLKDWSQMLKDRGAVVNGKIGFPTAEELENTDVIVFYTEEGGRINTEDRANLDKFLKRGGGIVAIHDSVCGNDAQ